MRPQSQVGAPINLFPNNSPIHRFHRFAQTKICEHLRNLWIVSFRHSLVDHSSLIRHSLLRHSPRYTFPMLFTSNSPEETLALGRRLGALALPGQLIALHGNLGAGKTLLTRGIAEGAQVADIGLVSSPTYVLCNIYPRDPAN